MGKDLVLSQKFFHGKASPKPAFFDILASDRPSGMELEPCVRNISISEKRGNRVLFLLHDTEVPNYKYIIGRTIRGKRVMAILPLTRVGRHCDIVEYARKELGLRVHKIRGGLMVMSKGRIQIFGRSEQYGRANHAEAASILKEFLGNDSGFRFSCRQ